MGFRLVVITVLLTIFLGIPRFAHHTPDSRHYVNLAGYFQGEVHKEQLLKPYASRILVPYMATLLPLDNLNTSMALINIGATISAYLLFIIFLKELGMTTRQVQIGTLVLVVSFPTFNYSSGVLTDPAGFLFFVLGCYFLLKENYNLLSFTAAIGILARESIVLLVLISVIDILLRFFYRPRETQEFSQVLKNLLLVSVIPLVTFFAAKSYLFHDVPTNFNWGVSLQFFLENIRESKMGWLTFPLTLFPPLLLLFYGIGQGGWRHISTLHSRIKIMLSAITAVSIMYIIYSNCIPTAYLSGRFVWPFYCVLIPVSVLAIQQTNLFRKWGESITEKLFGKFPEDK